MAPAIAGIHGMPMAGGGPVAPRQQPEECARRSALRVCVLALAALPWLVRSAAATDYPLAASAMVLKDSGGRQRLRLVTAPGPLGLPSGLPSVTGASIEIRNPASRESAALSIPPGDGWSSDG